MKKECLPLDLKDLLYPPTEKKKKDDLDGGDGGPGNQPNVYVEKEIKLTQLNTQ